MEIMNDQNRVAIPTSNMEPNTGDESMGKEKTEGLDSRVNIHVISYRARNHDPDGISSKAVIDGIVRRGLLSDDSAKEVKKVSYESHICKKGEVEKTIIEITRHE